MRKGFPEEQIIGFLREAEAGMAVKELCRRHGFSEASYYLWRSKFGGMGVQLRDLEAENAWLKKLLSEQLLENDVIKDALRKSGERTGAQDAGAAFGRARAHREAGTGRGTDERQCTALCPAPRSQCRASRADTGAGTATQTLRCGMTYLKLRQEQWPVNYKRVERLYQEAKLQVRRCKRKRVLLGERQPLLQPEAANQVWSMDFVFDRTAEGRVIKALTIVDDATQEAAFAQL